MIPDAIISCSYLLLGSGWCIYRLAKYSNDTLSKVLPQFIIASVGIAAIGARSMHALFYNLFWRSYPIDPMLIAKELEELKNDRNFIDWILSKAGIASLVYSFYYHYEFAATGSLIVITLSVFEILYFIEEIVSSKQTKGEILEVSSTGVRIAAFIRSLPFPPATFWIVSNELFGRAVKNPYCRLANVPYAISTWAFPREGFYTGWSMNDTINDYMMLSYVIVITESLCKVPINH